MRIRGIVFLTGLFLLLPLNAQNNSEIKEVWLEAETHYLFGEYELANPLYLMLNDLIPGDANIKYKIGNCYLNIFDEKAKAIPFLEEAIRNVDYNAKPGKLKEDKAPLDAYFSLANAYRITNRIDSAINTYRYFLKLVSEAGKMENQDFINQQIEACNIATIRMNSPIKVLIQPLSESINHGSVNDYPVISFDGNTMAYTERRGLENVIYVSHREGETWGDPVDITIEASTGTDCHTTSLNNDGTELYLFKNDTYNGSIFMTSLIDGVWSPIKKLNKNINTKFNESHASVSADGEKLYFTSNREGGQGELDIWVSEKDETGDWGPAVNLGNTVNTPYNEETPFISSDGNTLTFSSEGHSSMGGYDIFISRFASDKWRKPVNIGYPVNTTDDDIGFQPYGYGVYGLYSVMTGYKKKDITFVNFNPPEEMIRDTVTISFDLADLPYLSQVDSASLITDMTLRDVLDTDEEYDPDVLYYTVQVMALHNPVDPEYFEYAEISVFYDLADRFYRYTTGKFKTRAEAYNEMNRLLRLGYPTDIFVKKVYKNDTGR